MDKTLRKSLLFDFYGGLLTSRQQAIYQLYFHDDLSLAEISEQYDVSRQAIYDILKRTSQALEGYEEKLGLVAKYEKEIALLKDLDNFLARVGAMDVFGEEKGLINDLRFRIRELLEA